MAKAFYLKLAATNLLRNKRMYGPYIVAVALIGGMFSIILNLIFSRSVSNLSYGGTVQIMFTFGLIVMTLFTVGYMLYLNSFLIKRRKKEFGLYGVLGMERRHVARVILWESLIIGFGALSLGLVGGAVFGRLAFMVLMRILDTAQGSVYVLDMRAMLVTLAVFCGIFVLTTLYNLNQVRLASPVDLLRGEQKGEKKVRFVWPIAILGFALLGYAYHLAISVRTYTAALMLFWPAVILVILATWLVFTGGSVFVLNLLRKNPRIYYRPRNFITLSGLSYRVRQNAAGLANICILSTMVMVTVACCVSLYFGQDAISREQNPQDIYLEIGLSDEALEADAAARTMAAAYRLADEAGIGVEEAYSFRRQQRAVLLHGDRLMLPGDAALDGLDDAELEENVVSVYLLPLDDYNAVTGARETLAEGEALLLSTRAQGDTPRLLAGDQALSVKAVRTDTPFTTSRHGSNRNVACIVLRDTDALTAVMRLLDPQTQHVDIATRMILNLDADLNTGYTYVTGLREAFYAIAQAASETLGTDQYYRTSDIYNNRLDGYSFYGGLLFLGVFFAILFLINTVLILYFKQISEGYDDNERFAILQKVGLSDVEVKSTINRQMLIVFLAPLVMALVHIAAASHMIQMLLGLFSLTDFSLTLLCIVITSAVFIAVYLLVYRLTARTYYRLVKW